MKYYSVDRFEENFTVLVDDSGKIYNFKTRKLPKNIKEGDILKKNKNDIFEIDYEETEKRKEIIYKLQKKLFKDK